VTSTDGEGRGVTVSSSSLRTEFLEGFEPTVEVEVDGLGPTLFCHGSPRSDEEIITSITPNRACSRCSPGDPIDSGLWPQRTVSSSIAWDRGAS